MLALAVVTLAGAILLGRVQDPNHPNAVLSLISVIGFLLSGYFVLQVRSQLIPIGRTWQVAAGVLLAISILVGALDVLFLTRTSSPVTTLVTLELVGAWAIFTGEPIVRFWLASNRLPAVQRARLRFLSAGFAVLIVILFVAVLGGSALQGPTAILITQVVALAVVPAIYVSFAPPTLLRRIWRMGEESEVRAAMQDLLIFSTSRQVLAERAAYWAVRLMGATSGFVTDVDGEVLATSGIDPERAAAVAAGGPSEKVIAVPLHLGEGQGTLAI